MDEFKLTMSCQLTNKVFLYSRVHVCTRVCKDNVAVVPCSEMVTAVS